MESNIGIDSKPRARRGRRRFTDRLAALAGDRSDDISDSAGTVGIRYCDVLCFIVCTGFIRCLGSLVLAFPQKAFILPFTFC